MQRKQLLKGRIYREGYSLVKILDTTNSPVEVERYDIVNQTWAKGTAQPRDIDAPFGNEVSASSLQGYNEAINAAWKRRFNHAMLDAVNNYFGVSGSISTRLADTRIGLRTSGEDGAKVTFSTQDYNKIVGAKTVGPEISGNVTMRADYFRRWALGPLDIDCPEVADIQPLPGIDPELQDADFVRRVEAALTDLREKIGKANAIWQEVHDEHRARAEAAEKTKAEAEGRRARHISVDRRGPEVLTEARERVAAAGLDPEAHLSTSFRAAELSVDDLRKLGYDI